MDLIITILPVVAKDLPISPRFTPYNFLSRCKFSTLTTRQPMVESSRTSVSMESFKITNYNGLLETGIHFGSQMYGDWGIRTTIVVM